MKFERFPLLTEKQIIQSGCVEFEKRKIAKKNLEFKIYLMELRNEEEVLTSKKDIMAPLPICETKCLECQDQLSPHKYEILQELWTKQPTFSIPLHASSLSTWNHCWIRIYRREFLQRWVIFCVIYFSYCRRLLLNFLILFNILLLLWIFWYILFINANAAVENWETFRQFLLQIIFPFRKFVFILFLLNIFSVCCRMNFTSS